MQDLGEAAEQAIRQGRPASRDVAQQDERLCATMGAAHGLIGLVALGAGSCWLGVGQRTRRLEQGAGGGTAFGAGGAGQAVMTDFGEAFGQDVLNKAFDKFGDAKLDVLDLLGLVVAIAKGDLAVLELFQS